MKIESRENLLNVPIYQVVLALGSNHEALANLEQARQALENWLQLGFGQRPMKMRIILPRLTDQSQIM